MENQEEKQSGKSKKYKDAPFQGREMKEIVSKSLLKINMIVTAILIVIFASYTSYDVISSEINTLNVTLEQTEEGMCSHEELEKKTQQLFVDDYVNRVNNISAILKLNEEENLTADYLKELADFEDISNIYIVNNEGVITQSSDSSSLGLDLYNEPELDTFIPLIESEENGYYCDFSNNAAISENNMIYLMVRNEENKLIMIEIESSTYQNYRNGSSTLKYIEQIPTKWNRTIAMIDNNTGELLSITKNNLQTIDGDNLLAKFKEAENHPIIAKINGSWQLVMSKQASDSRLLVEFSAMTDLIKQIVYNILIFSVLIFILHICVLYFLIKVLNKVVLQDISNMYEDVKSFALGKNVEFSDASTKELSELSKQLRRLKERINNSRNELQLAISVLGEGFAGYEYDAEYDHLLYVNDDGLKLLGLTEDELLEEVKAIYEQNKPKRGENKFFSSVVYLKNGKIIKFNRYLTYDTVYAIAEDITERENYKNKLLLDQENIYVDELTKLNNRRKLEQVLRDENYTKDNPEGVMLLMDLDNFKKVNDEKGHMEGDVLLKKFADLIRNNFRETDFKVRLGGDEFVVFIPYFINEETLIQKIQRFIETVRSELREYYIELHISVSIGAVYMDSECNCFEALYHCADSAMYMAKRSGKDSFYINKEHKDGIRETCIMCQKECEKRNR